MLGARTHLDFEQTLAPVLAQINLQPVHPKADVGFDFSSPDESVILEVKATTTSFREFDAAVMRLALGCQRLRPARAILGLWGTKLSLASIRGRWTALSAVLATDVAARLQLVVSTPTEHLALPADERGEFIARALRAAAETVGPSARRPDRSFEVLKVLLSRWLRGDRALPIHDLQRVTGLSYPSVSAQLSSLGPVVDRTSNRSVLLREFPIRDWERLVALAPGVRQSRAFVDHSGRPRGLGSLVQRVRQRRFASVAIGGVVAVRNHWHRATNLVGTPRLDLEVHAPAGMADLAFVHDLDPALQPARTGDEVPVLVVHALVRAEPLFVDDAEGGTPWADPVEVLLDLADLRLGEQVEALVGHLRGHR